MANKVRIYEVVEQWPFRVMASFFTLEEAGNYMRGLVLPVIVVREVTRG